VRLTLKLGKQLTQSKSQSWGNSGSNQLSKQNKNYGPTAMKDEITKEDNRATRFGGGIPVFSPS